MTDPTMSPGNPAREVLAQPARDTIALYLQRSCGFTLGAAIANADAIIAALSSAGMVIVPRMQPLVGGTAVPTICTGCGGEIVAVMGSVQSLWVPGRGIFHGTSCVHIDDARPLPTPTLPPAGDET